MFMATNTMRACATDEFSCQVCGSPSIAVPASLHSDAEVSCGRCGLFVATWGEFCRNVDQALSHAPIVVGSPGTTGASQP